MGRTKLARQPAKWRTYEEVAVYLLNSIAEEFGVDKFEGPQKVEGIRSGTTWSIEGKGICVGGERFLIVECRRKGRPLEQEAVGAVAYRIHDSQAEGAIIVSPCGLQEGGEKIAAAEGIWNIYLAPDSSTSNYILKFLTETGEKGFLGVGDQGAGRDEICVEKYDDNGERI